MATPTVVLVHGAWHGGWCWSNVVAALGSAGIDAIAVDLPGHEVAGKSQRKWNTLSSYVDHVHSVIDSIDGDVVLVGHSMGGLVSQRVLETRSVAAAVLVASVPLRGVAGVVVRLIQNHPKQFLATMSLSLWALVENDERVREHFFTLDTDSAVVSNAGSKMQNESYVAFLSMLTRWPRATRLANGSTKISVVAAEHDAIFTLDEQRSLASAYGAELEVIDCGHDIMLDARWMELVEHIHDRVASVTAV